MTPQRDLPLSWLDVDLSAIRQNYSTLRGLLNPGVRAFGVIKADAYGHGAVEAARALQGEGADFFCVARVEEAQELRDAGIGDQILIFGPPFRVQAEASLGLNAAMALSNEDHLEAVIAAARAVNRRASVHLKIDTGMGRLGVQPGEALEFARRITAAPELELAGVMSHLACADMPGAPSTPQQIQAFADVRTQIQDAGIAVGVYHLANSAGTMAHPASHHDAVRLGIALYGQYPSLEMPRNIPLQPAMAMKTRVLHVKDIPPDCGLSYGHTFVSPAPMRVATVALGYADGYPRHASNMAIMLVGGASARVLGRVCMDLSIIDVTSVPEVRPGDEVLVFGREGEHCLRAEELAATFGTIGYELTTRVGKRLPRFFRG